MSRWQGLTEHHVASLPAMTRNFECHCEERSDVAISNIDVRFIGHINKYPKHTKQKEC